MIIKSSLFHKTVDCWSLWISLILVYNQKVSSEVHRQTFVYSNGPILIIFSEKIRKIKMNIDKSIMGNSAFTVSTKTKHYNNCMFSKCISITLPSIEISPSKYHRGINNLNNQRKFNYCMELHEVIKLLTICYSPSKS